MEFTGMYTFMPKHIETKGGTYVMEQRGRLLVTTKSNSTGRKTAATVSCVGAAILVVMFIAFFAILGFDGMGDIGEELFGSTFLGYCLIPALIIIILCPVIFNTIVVFNAAKSYVDVYENCLVGKTALSSSRPNEPMQDFELQYSEINNVTESGKNIIIYTSYHSYEVAALNNHSEAVNEIRKRISRA